MDMKFVSELDKLLLKQKKIVIIPHRNPDGDALGSSLALKHYLSKKGHEATVISPNDYPSFLKFLPGESEILKYSISPNDARKRIYNAEIIFTLDFNSLVRAQDLTDIIKNSSAKKIMIDHHQAPENYSDLQYSDTSMSSTCEMLYKVMKALDFDSITQTIACCLYTGIMTDTGSFKYPSTTSETHKAVANLLELGADSIKIHQKIYDSSSFSRLKLLGITLSNLVKIPKLPVVYMTLTQKELNFCNFQKGDTEGFVNYGLNLEGINFSCIMIENENEKKIKMSFRSQGKFSVNSFARIYFNGGGHNNAAGGYSLDSLENTIIKFKKALDEIGQEF